MEQWPCGQGAGFPIQGYPSQKPLDGSKVDSAFLPSEDDQMSTRNSLGFSGKK